ncbi:MAG TPA: SpoIIE family protein phosphatase [Solirubrobacteraceae bacterium]|nr:SpoIIE family protein phosphatase [Solirubrobacteraceae bacterium]
MRSNLSPRLAIALALQAAIVVLDVVLSGSTVVSSAALLVPFGLAIIGTERETAVAAAVAFAIGIGSLFWNDAPSTGQGVYRIVFFALAGLLTVIAARARERATNLAVDLEATQARLDGILGSLGEAVTVHDERGKTVYANEAAARLLGCESVEEVLAAEPGALAARFSITHEDGTAVAVADLPGRRLMAGERSSSLLTRSIRRDTGEALWLLTKATLTRERSGAPLAINIIEDVSDAKEAELRQRFLAEAGQLLATSLDYEQTLERIARMIVPRLADWCGIDMVQESGDVTQVAVAHVDPAKVELARAMRERYPPDMTATTGLPAIIRGGPAELYRDIPDELLVAAAQDEEHLRIARDVGLRSAMAVPMRIGAETLGVITFASAESGRSFDEDDLAFAQDLALRAASAVQNARLYEAQERVAHTLQASLLPEQLPDVPGWEIHAAYQAGERGADVGGDFYDVLAVASGHLIVLGDVTGKGIEAAALTSLVRHSARMAARFDPSPARVLSLVNEVLREQPRLSLVTAVCALVSSDGAAARLTVASAGHPLPLLRRPGAAPEPVGDHGVLLGVEGEDDWTDVGVSIERGDTVLFYTDGVTETPGDAARYGEPRLCEAMARAGDGPVALLSEIERSLREFQSGQAIDDRAMLALRFVGVETAVA